jgi:hypothetical protein
MSARETSQQFEQVLRRNTVNGATYRAYYALAKQYRRRNDQTPVTVALGDAATQPCSLRFHRSLLFQRDYLVADVEDDWLRTVAPTCDAIAATLTSGPRRVPPLVILPARKVGLDDEETISIIEHEIVHINQALLGTMPERNRLIAIKGARSEFFRVVESEYDANFLQLTRWPALLPEHHKDSPEYWCVLRGWVDAIQDCVQGVFCPASVLPRLLVSLPKALDAEFSKLGVSSSLSVRFATDLTRHVSLAIEDMEPLSTSPQAKKSIEAAKRWVSLHQARSTTSEA